MAPRLARLAALTALVGALAAIHPPTRITFLLIDFTATNAQRFYRVLVGP